MRKLATIREIEDITPIEGADRIDLAHIGGWRVIVRKGEYSIGDVAIYCEVDSWIPSELAPFLFKGEPKQYKDVYGGRLRTIRLRGQVSQGLLLPIDHLKGSPYFPEDGVSFDDLIGVDVSDFLKIQKWEETLPSNFGGKMKGSFPCFIPKTDQERIQNLREKTISEIISGDYEISEKLEGSSITIFKDQTTGKIRVCSRNIELNTEDKDSIFVKVAFEEGFESIEGHYAFQGELIGKGVQGNIYRCESHRIHVYSVYDFKNGRYLPPKEASLLTESFNLRYVPVLEKPGGLKTLEQFLEFSEGRSVFSNTQREGIVVKSECGQKSFKVINNKYLLGEK